MSAPRAASFSRVFLILALLLLLLAGGLWILRGPSGEQRERASDAETRPTRSSSDAGPSPLGDKTVLASVTASEADSGAPAAASAPVSVTVERAVWRARTPLRLDRRPDFGADLAPARQTIRKEVPAAVAAFDAWLARYEAASSASHAVLAEEGATLLKARMEQWPEWARRDPEAALLLSPAPASRARLPAEMQAMLEQPLAVVGFYGVRATCSHGDAGHGPACRIDREIIVDGRLLEAAVYGERLERLTEEDASLYGMVVGNLVVLHADDVVLRPAGGDAESSVEIIYRGQIARVDDPATLPARLRSLLTP